MKSKLIAIVAAVVLVGVWLLMPPPIHRAAFSGNIEAVKQHLADGVDVDAKSWGFTLLHAATDEGHKEIVELLIAEGADVNVKDWFRFTPLHDAADRGHKEITELLIAEGADVNLMNKDGVTPLHEAATYGHKEVAELLIAEGADVNAEIMSVKFRGETALDWAIAFKETELADLLRKHGGKTGEELKAEGK